MNAETALLLAAVGLSLFAGILSLDGYTKTANWLMIVVLGLAGAVLGLLLLGGAP